MKKKIEMDEDGYPSQEYQEGDLGGTLMFFGGDNFPSLVWEQISITLPEVKQLVAALEKFDKEARIEYAKWDKKHNVKRNKSHNRKKKRKQ